MQLHSQHLRLSSLGRLFLAFSLLIASFSFVMVSSVRVTHAATADTNIPQTKVSHKGALVGNTATQTMLDLAVSLKESNPQAETQFISDLYNPQSSSYHHYLTPAQYAAQFGPTAASRSQVVSYLQSQGFQVTTNDTNGTVIDFQGSVSTVEKAFNVSINNYKDAAGRVFYGNDRTPTYPTSISQVINGIVGLSNETKPQPHLVRGTQGKKYGSAPGGGYSPNEVRNAYNVTNLINSGYDGTNQKVALYELDGYTASNIQVFTSNYGLNPPALQNISVDGASAVSNDGDGEVEVELDIEAVMAVAPKAQILVYVATGSGSSYLDEYQKIADDDLAQSISTSWGNYNENDPSLLQSEETILRQYAVQGQSFYSASGDIDSDPYNIADNDNREDGDPEDNPYATSVGGTRLYLNGTDAGSSYYTETTWNEGFYFNSQGITVGIGTTGGISTYFSKTETPWQVGPGTDLSNTYNPNGFRQEPDVAALADPTPGFGIYSTGRWFPEGGTSLASPLWAGFTAVMNQYSLQNGGTQLGFPAPSLYAIFNNPTKYAADFHDITVGTNDINCPNQAYPAIGPNQNSCTSKIYPATVGYDLATGIGTPNVAALAIDLKNASVPQSKLSVSPNSVQLVTDPNNTPVSQTITLSSANASTTYSSTTSASWLIVSDPADSIAANGSITMTVTANDNSLAVGTYTGTVTFADVTAPTSDYAVLTVTLKVKNQTTVTLTSSPNPSNFGQPVNFTAIVASSNTVMTPTGVVTFTDNVNGVLGSSTLTNGVASFSTSSLITGTHAITATYSGDNNFASSLATTTQVVTATASTIYTYNLPFVANGYASSGGSFTTFLALQNIGSGAAHVSFQFYDASGNAIATNVLSGTANCSPVPVNGECLPNNPFSSGNVGTGIISSDQPLNVVVPEATPYGGSAYVVVSGSSNSLVAPFALNNAFGDFTSQLNIFNSGSSAVSATVTFYGTVGTSSTITTSTTTFNVPAHTTTNLNQNTLPSGFSGWAQITGTNSTLVAQVLEQSPSQKFVAIANAIFTPSAKLYAPAVFNSGYGSFTTGENIINPNSNPVTVTVTYYNKDTNAVTPAAPFVLAPHAVQSIYQGASSGVGVPAGGLTNGFVGAEIISSTGGGVVMSVNENGGLTAAGNSRSGVYAAAATGGSNIGLPVISNGGYTYITGDTIFNTSSQTVTATLSYYTPDGTSVTGASKILTIPGHASAAFYQGDGSLPSGFYGTAVLTETNSSPANALIVTTNAQNVALFYTYTEPNS